MGQLIFSSLPMFVSGFWALLLLCSLLESFDRTRLVLSLFMGNTALLYFGHCVFFNEFHSLIPVCDTLYTFTTLAAYPLLYIYLLSLTSPARRLRTSWLMLLPAFIMSIVVGVQYQMMTPAETRVFIERCLYNEQFFGFTGIVSQIAITHLIIKIAIAFNVLWVMVAALNALVGYDLHIKSVYSNVEGKTLISFKIFLYLFCFTSLASFAFNIIGRYNFDSSFAIFTLPATIFSVLIFILGLLGLRQKFTYETIEAELQEPIEAVSAIDQTQNTKLAERIDAIIEEKQLFLLPNLKVSDIANELCTNRLYISHAINSVMHLSFSDYINKKRIEFATQLFCTQPNKPITDIALESGFASQNSFYRNFKNFKGCSPKVFARNHNTPPTPPPFERGAFIGIAETEKKN